MRKKLSNISVFFVIVIGLVSCDFFDDSKNVSGVIELDENYLTREEIASLLPTDYTTEDSLRIVEGFLKEWMLNVALNKKALENIPDDRQKELNMLVSRYKDQLYSQEYLTELTKQNLDTAISINAIKSYYEKKSEEFRLNEDLLRLTYVKVDPFYDDLDLIKKWVRKNDSASMFKLDSLKLTYKDYLLKDSLWLRKSTVFEKIDFLNASNEGSYVRENKFTEYTDSTGLYLMQINKVLKRGNISPLSFIKPTIKQIILNRKKLEYKKELEKDLLQDAKLRLKNRLYE
ncbi:MAG: hypothetical protein WBG46_12180 [Nonlabens sp.]